MGSGSVTPTEDALSVFWEGRFDPGVIAYGLRPEGRGGIPLFPSATWPEGTEHKTSALRNDRWEVWVWDVRVLRWPEPSQWPDVLNRTLQKLGAAGAIVAWCGLEGHFVDPPDLFKPSCMSGSVYAALSELTGFVCRAQLGAELQTLDDSELLQLRAVAESVWTT